MADVYNAKISVPSVLEEAGSAVTGGVGAGIFKDFSAIDKFISINSVHMPDSSSVAAYAPVRELFDECYFALEGVFNKMSRKY